MYRLFFFIFFLSFSPFLVHAQSPDNLPPPATDEDLSSAIVFHLSEIMSCPFTGEPEWIEIYNDSDFDWEMVGWKIRNKNNVTRNIASHLITASSLVVIEFSSGVLGNSGDTFSLENNLGEVFFTVTIPACSANGTSFVFNGSSWVETPTPTPAAPNSSPSSSPNNTSPTAGDPHSTPASSSNNSNSSSTTPSPDDPSPSPPPSSPSPASFAYPSINLSAVSTLSFSPISSSSPSLASEPASLAQRSAPSNFLPLSLGITLTLLGGGSAAYFFFAQKTSLLPTTPRPRSAWEEHSDSLDVL